VWIEAEGDIERLRQVALLLQNENSRLFRRLEDLAAELARLKGEQPAEQLALEIALLKEKLQARERELFSPSSEKRSKDPCDGLQEKRLQTGHGPRHQPELPIVEAVHILDEADKICPKCGGGLQVWAGQFEQSDEIDVVERSYRVVRHKRQKYRCQCGECIDTALGPDKFLPGGRYSVDFAISVAIGKYADHLPLARQRRMMARDGLLIDTQTLWDQIFVLARHLGPTYEALHDLVLQAPVIGADETTWRLLGSGSKSWWAWSVCSPDAVVYQISPTRSAKDAGRILRDFSGVVVADGYSAYRTLRDRRAVSRDGSPFELAACWAHVRRKFLEAEPDHPEATPVLELIGDLYGVEAEGREAPDRLAMLRGEKSRELVDQLRDALLAIRALPRSSLGTAVSYTFELWPALTRFLDDSRIPLDNNQTERALRGVVIGRKNHYGSRSLRGTMVAALFYSLIESAKLCGVEPRAYLREATRRAIAQPGAVTVPRALLEA